LPARSWGFGWFSDVEAPRSVGWCRASHWRSSPRQPSLLANQVFSLKASLLDQQSLLANAFSVVRIKPNDLADQTNDIGMAGDRALIAGLVRTRRSMLDGRVALFYVDPTQLRQIPAWLAGTEIARPTTRTSETRHSLDLEDGSAWFERSRFSVRRQGLPARNVK
jgi:hypothetical protein